MRRQWILPGGMVAAMVVLTPTVIHTRSTSWVVGWSAILPGVVGLLMLLALVEHLTPPADRAESDLRERLNRHSCLAGTAAIASLSPGPGTLRTWRATAAPNLGPLGRIPPDKGSARPGLDLSGDLTHREAVPGGAGQGKNSVQPRAHREAACRQVGRSHRGREQEVAHLKAGTWPDRPYDLHAS